MALVGSDRTSFSEIVGEQKTPTPLRSNLQWRPIQREGSSIEGGVEVEVLPSLAVEQSSIQRHPLQPFERTRLHSPRHPRCLAGAYRSRGKGAGEKPYDWKGKACLEASREAQSLAGLRVHEHRGCGFIWSLKSLARKFDRGGGEWRRVIFLGYPSPP
jgi:hypothetical protein